MTPAYRANGFARFFDQLILHGLEKFNLYYGRYRANVVENVDENNQGCIFILCPAVGDTPKTPPRKAYPIASLAGNGYGVQNLPPAGSHCYVEFEYGRLDTPIWLGGWWAKEELPDDFKDNVDMYGIVTPAGHKVLLNGLDGEEEISVVHTNGAEVKVDVDGNIYVTNVDGKVVYVGKDATEAAALGDTLLGLLEELVDAIVALTVGTGTGPSSTPINVATFQNIKSRLKEFLSATVKVAD